MIIIEEHDLKPKRLLKKKQSLDHNDLKVRNLMLAPIMNKTLKDQEEFYRF